MAKRRKKKGFLNFFEKFFIIPITQISESTDDVEEDVKEKDIAAWSLAVLRLTLIIAFFSFVAVAIGTYVIILEFNKSHEISEKTNEILNELKMTFPPNNADVGPSGIVEGYSPYQDKNAYVLITAINNVEYLQPKSKIGVNGVWRATVYYGDDTTPSGAIFYIRTIVTTVELNPSDWHQNIPEDAIFSNSLMVTLRK